MIKSESIVKLADALVKAQAEMPAAKMDANNPFYKSKYATLGAVIDAAKPILAKNNLAVSQPIVYDGDKVGVETILIHSSGEYISNICCIPIVVSERNAQIAGSTISYLRRYGLAAILGIYSDEDTDGEPEKKKSEKKSESDPKPEHPWGAAFLREQIKIKISHRPDCAKNDIRMGIVASMIEYAFDIGGIDAKTKENIRHSVTKYLIAKPSLKDAVGKEIEILYEWLKPKQDTGGAWTPDKNAVLECQKVWDAANLEAGQLKLGEDQK